MESVSFVKATHADVEMISRMRVDFLTEYWGKQSDHKENMLLENLHNYFRQTLNSSSMCWYAKSAETIVGIGFIEIHDQPGNFKNPSGKIGHVMNMYTIKTFRKRGICTTILNKLIESASELGVTAFELHASNAGMPVYEKNGFKLHKDPTMRRYIDPS
ncbi:MAG: GNAT family N-acetyltransferase [Bacteroidetes bacterium]|jgi:GNAT superfamily N-acetyltransferase|nr:GNAT family N-acetyltransferase [Bacteroidota bacterium]MBL0030768.1 GNAT family N-acetyltransferase [Bacteroidota bacterium]MBP6426185.1 GNAT family N-acetyltransferase [Bacteroidia bacterium]